MSFDASYLAAAVQMNSGPDKSANLLAAIRLVEEAADRGARLVVLPEYFNHLARLEDMAAAGEEIPGPTSEAMSQLAARLKITLVAGSICERSGREGKVHNTSLVFDENGREVARYRKLHLFDVDLPGRVTVEESRFIEPGDRISSFSSPLGTIGQATCYDLRFPELFRALAGRGMQVLAFPSAFSQPTGEAHWHVLLRARAIENQCYVVAANQYGRHLPELSTYGHSLIVDPWGEVVAEAGEARDAVVTAEIDLFRMAEIRRQLPALEHRREDICRD